MMIEIDRGWKAKQEAVDLLSVRDGYFCFICKEKFGAKEKPTLDHWIPISKGGTWNIENLRLAHKSCNLWKGDRVPLEDGSIPERPKPKSSYGQKRIRKQNRPKVCNTCMSGRLLSVGERCNVCNSGPEPIIFPAWAKRKSFECDHYIYHCFACIVGFKGRRNGVA